MGAEAIHTLNRARASLVRERDALARRIAGMDLAPVTMAEDHPDPRGDRGRGPGADGGGPALLPPDLAEG